MGNVRSIGWKNTLSQTHTHTSRTNQHQDLPLKSSLVCDNAVAVASRAAMTQSLAYITCRALRICCNEACFAVEDSKDNTIRDSEGLAGSPPVLLELPGVALASPPRGSVTPENKELIKRYTTL